METLSRWAGWLAIAGGAIAVLAVIGVAMDPSGWAWSGFFVVIVLLGAAVLGLQARTDAATGQLGRWSARLSALGALGLILVFAYAAASGRLVTEGGSAASELAPLWIVTAVAWLVGALGYAVALSRAKELSVVGAWLVIAGTVAGIVVSVALGENVPSVVLLVFGLFGIGWILVGYAALQPRATTAA